MKSSMKSKRLLQSVAMTAAAFVMTAASATAITITYQTTGANTGFNGTSALLLNSTSGSAATLTFVPNASGTSGVPSNINLGDFTLACGGCTPVSGSTFSAFTFNLRITDTTNSASGTFVGSSAGGTIFSDAANLAITWAPTQIGPGTNNAASGNFGPTFFTKQLVTQIVAPNSGTPVGNTSVQGFVNSSEIPEPATLGLMGVAMVGLGLWRKRQLSAK